MRRTLEGSFSAVSRRIFASKYAFENSRRDLHNALESNPPMKRNGRKEENGKIILGKIASEIHEIREFEVLRII